MRMQQIFSLAAVFLLLSCQSNQQPQNDGDFSNFVAPVDSSINTKDPVYPYPDYIRAQLEMVDTIPYAIERILTINGKTIDSGYVSREVLKKEAQPFLEIDPNEKSIRNQFIETSFNDLSLGLVTFSITSKFPEQKLQQANILVNPENNGVKNVILRKQFAEADSSVEQMLLWKDKMNFQISEVITKKDNSSYNRVLKIIWDKPLE